VTLYFSTVSTGITALASVTVEDFLKPVFPWKDDVYTWVSRGKNKSEIIEIQRQN